MIRAATAVSSLCLLVACASLPKVEEGYGGALALKAVLEVSPLPPLTAAQNARALTAILADPLRFDADKDGGLDFAEYLERNFVRYALFDANADRRLTEAEFALSPAQPPNYGPLRFRQLAPKGGSFGIEAIEREVAFDFRNYDADRNGKVTPREFAYMAEGGARRSRPLVADTVAPVSELMGLTPNEIRDRFRLNRADAFLAREIRLGDAGPIAVTDAFFLTRTGGGCDNGGRATLIAEPRGLMELTFENGRFSGASIRFASGAAEPVPAITLGCSPRGSEEIDNPVEGALFIALFAPWLALGVAQQAVDDARQARAAAPLADLRLGDPPPGGLDAYAAAPPAKVTVRRLGPGDAEIAFDLADRVDIPGRPDALAVVRGGRVVSIAKPISPLCEVDAQVRLRC